MVLCKWFQVSTVSAPKIAGGSHNCERFCRIFIASGRGLMANSVAYRASIAAAILAALAVAAPPNVIAFNAASGNLIANGDFSANASAFVVSPGYINTGNVSGIAGQNPPAPTGWTVGPGQNTVGVNGSDTGFYKSATNGGAPFAPASTAGVRDFVFLQNRGVFASQTVTTATGQTYTLTYDAAARINETSDVLKVVLIDTATGKQIATREPAIRQGAFRPFALQFTAPSASTRVEFLNNSPAKSDNTVDVSNVALVKGAQRALLSLDTQISPPQVKSITVRVNRTVVFDGQCVVVSAMAERFKGTGDVPFAPASLADVGDFAFIQNGGNGPANSISQTVATTTGKPYRLTYDAAARGGEASDRLEVVITDAANGRRIITQTPAIADTAFQHFSLKFTAPSASTRIEFLNKSVVGTGLTVDVSNVVLTAAGAGGARANLIANGDFSANAARFINAPGYARDYPNPNTLQDWVTGRGSMTVGVNVARIVLPIPVSGLKVRAMVNGQPWCASEMTLPSGVAHLLLPLPEVGANVITVRGGSVTSAPVTVQVERRRFKIITDPKHLIGMDYETWFGPGYAQWGYEEAIPILGHYSSLDPRVLRQQTLWFNQMGINFVELDWTNNLVRPFPGAAARECIAAENALFHLYARMRQHPKIVIMVGPEHNLWVNNHSTPYTGPWFEKQLNYLYAHYINNPKYRNMYLHYHGKPLLMCYLNGPRFARPPVIHDPRFTIRFMGAWLQYTKEQRYGVWSWYDQKATPTFYHGKAEALTVTDGYPGIHSPGGLNNWLSPDAGGKNYGETYRTQWRVADKYLPHFLFLCQWNEFEPPDQYNANLSNDMEPTLMTEPGSHRPSGWGFFYNNLTRREIRRYHRLIAARRMAHTGVAGK